MNDHKLFNDKNVANKVIKYIVFVDEIAHELIFD